MASVDRAAVDGFEPHRKHLTGLAYRMLGSLAEAEDAVQEAYLRWHRTDQTKVTDARAFLSKTVTRLCLDQLKSARARRETYVGPWLPEPLLEDAGLATETAGEYAHDLSVALLLALERLSPLERAAFLLHDVFDMAFAEVAETLGRDEAACRQLAARARAHVRVARPRFPVPPDEGARLAEAFMAAARSGDAGALARLLTADAALHSDGGGKKRAALNVIRGRDKIAAFFAGLARKEAAAVTAIRVRPARINGLPGFVAVEPDGTVQTIALEIAGAEIAAIYVVRNPDKLRHVAA
ncbi:MAG TPA: sigma-70 family RNA polymerase sigma factor [Candidatus Acidoferrum sp.]|nr:sigma-70 family RNA polymerase sigma factor [Candidatus Acidoferrum sp.]